MPAHATMPPAPAAVPTRSSVPRVTPPSPLAPQTNKQLRVQLATMKFKHHDSKRKEKLGKVVACRKRMVEFELRQGKQFDMDAFEKSMRKAHSAPVPSPNQKNLGGPFEPPALQPGGPLAHRVREKVGCHPKQGLAVAALMHRVPTPPREADAANAVGAHEQSCAAALDGCAVQSVPPTPPIRDL